MRWLNIDANDLLVKGHEITGRIVVRPLNESCRHEISALERTIAVHRQRDMPVSQLVVEFTERYEQTGPH